MGRDVRRARVGVAVTFPDGATARVRRAAAVAGAYHPGVERHRPRQPGYVCGHSHVPFAAHDRGLTVFNPGSVGPRRFRLPIVFGVIDVRPEGVSLRHVDCETGLPWTPP